MINGTEGVTVSGADALLVVGLVALALALGAFAVIVRRLPLRAQAAATPEQQRAAQEQAAQAQECKRGRDVATTDDLVVDGRKLGDEAARRSPHGAQAGLELGFGERGVAQARGGVVHLSAIR